MMKRYLPLALLISFVFMVANAQQGEVAAVRVAHLAQGGPNVDIYVNGSRALQAVEAGTVSSYTPLPSGEHQVDVYEEGQGPSEGETGGDVETQPLTSSSVTLEAGQYYTVLATGAQGGSQTGGETGGSGEQQMSVQLQVLSDDLSSLPPAGSALVRVVHAAPSAPSVNIVAQMQAQGGETGGSTGGSTDGGETGGSQAMQGGSDLASGLSFGSTGDYAEVPEGAYQIQVQSADGGDAILNLNGVQLASGVVYSFFAGAPTEDSDAPLTVVTSVDALVAQQMQEEQ